MQKLPLVFTGLIVMSGVTGYHLMQQAPEAPTPPSPQTAMVEVILPAALSADAQLGQTIFQAKCAACHGLNAAGNINAAPPLIHKIYEPSHHADESFQRAVSQGVQAHHWRFGHMPPVKGLTRAEVASIIAYIREVQRANAIF